MGLQSRLQLFDLPVEVLEVLLLYVPPTLLITRVAATCRRLRDLLKSETFWKRRYASLVHVTVPLQGSWQYWQRGCVQGEFSYALSHGERAVRVSTLTGAAVGGFNCVHLMFPAVHGAVGLVAAGCHDSCIYMWRRRSTRETGDQARSMRDNVGYVLEGHKGWVWCLTSDPHRPELLCSGSWDSTVRVWDAVVGKSVATIEKQHRAAVLSMAIPQSNFLVTCSADKTVREFDLRVPVSLLANHQRHRHVVVGVACSESYVYSGGEDKCVIVWDRRQRRVLQTIKHGSKVQSLHCGYGKVSCADSSTVTMYDSSQGTLTNISSYSPLHSGSVTCVFHNLGMVATTSKDSTVAIYSPAPSHTHITSLHHHKSATTGLDCAQNALAVSSSDKTLSLWTSQHIT